ncbi:unnamed protein product [Urochloa humidicola]
MATTAEREKDGGDSREEGTRRRPGSAAARAVPSARGRPSMRHTGVRSSLGGRGAGAVEVSARLLPRGGLLPAPPRLLPLSLSPLCSPVEPSTGLRRRRVAADRRRIEVVVAARRRGGGVRRPWSSLGAAPSGSSGAAPYGIYAASGAAPSSSGRGGRTSRPAAGGVAGIAAGMERRPPLRRAALSPCPVVGMSRLCAGSTPTWPL